MGDVSGSNQRDILQYDVAIVGAGPSGLACALRLRQLDPSLTVCVLEKGAGLGAHSISGAILDPAPLDALWPAWRERPLDICVPVARDEFHLLTRRGAWALPVPPQQRNRGHLIVSLSQLVAMLGTHAEACGVDVFTGFAAGEALFNDAGVVMGVRLTDMGRLHDGSPGPNFSPGAEVHARTTVLAEGCRGSLSRSLIERFALDRGRSPPAYGLGLKELWQLPRGRVHTGLVQHSVGWPLPSNVYGGSFVYHLNDDRLCLGLIVGLDYLDPRLQPFEFLRQFKHHPRIRALLAGGEAIAYGARAVAAGGAQALPRLDMPGALLIGDAAGTLDFARLKGIHQAIRCGVLAAEHLHEHADSAGFDARWRNSPGGRDLHRVRNIKPGFKHGLWFGLANGLFETLTRGHSPWTLRHRPSWKMKLLEEVAASPSASTTNARTAGDAVATATSPAPDGASHDTHPARTLPPLDRSAAVFLAGTVHDERQPVHLEVADPSICIERCSRDYGNPCTRFCPAAVYEIIDDPAAPQGRRLQINAANCVHCKACDIKDPYEIITWTAPEGGSGPNYQNL